MRLTERLRKPVQLGRNDLPDRAALDAAIARIRDRWPELPSLPPEKDRERILRRFALRVRDDDWEGCTLAEAARALRIGCLPDYRRPEYRRAVRLLLDAMAGQARTLLVSAGLSAYLETWAENDEYTRALGGRLGRLPPERFPRRWRALIAALPALFDHARAPRAVAAHMAAADDPWAALRGLGVPDPHGPGLWAAAQASWLAAIAPEIPTEAGTERLLRWLHPEGARAPLPGPRAAAVIAALIGAWGARMPDPALVDRITSRLTALYGDPRLSLDGPWGALDRGLLEIYRRWLAGTDLRLFLDVITEAELRYTRADERHMWEPRRKFWLGLYEQGRILEAWPAFSPEAGGVADRRVAGRQLRLEYGRQWARRNLSILVMRVSGAKREFIVVEGSHSYKVHIFKARSRTAPKLYQPFYDAEAIRALPKHAEIVHRPWQWQTDVSWELDT